MHVPCARTKTQSIKEALNLAMMDLLCVISLNKVSYEYSVFIKPDLRPAGTKP